MLIVTKLYYTFKCVYFFSRAAHKYDEVASLEENLQDLKKEFWKKQTQQEDYARFHAYK